MKGYFFLYYHVCSAAFVVLLFYFTFKGKKFFSEKKSYELMNPFNLGFFEHLHEAVRIER